MSSRTIVKGIKQAVPHSGVNQVGAESLALPSNSGAFSPPAYLACIWINNTSKPSRPDPHVGRRVQYSSAVEKLEMSTSHQLSTAPTHHRQKQRESAERSNSPTNRTPRILNLRISYREKASVQLHWNTTTYAWISLPAYLGRTQERSR